MLIFVCILTIPCKIKVIIVAVLGLLVLSNRMFTRINWTYAETRLAMAYIII